MRQAINCWKCTCNLFIHQLKVSPILILKTLLFISTKNKLYYMNLWPHGRPKTNVLKRIFFNLGKKITEKYFSCGKGLQGWNKDFCVRLNGCKMWQQKACVYGSRLVELRGSKRNFNSRPGPHHLCSNAIKSALPHNTLLPWKQGLERYHIIPKYELYSAFCLWCDNNSYGFSISLKDCLSLRHKTKFTDSSFQNTSWNGCKCWNY